MVDLLPARTSSHTRATPISVARAPRLRLVTRSRAFAPLAVGVVTLIFTGIFAWVPSLWYDEAATVSAATRTLPQLFALLQNVDAVHGVYYTLMHFWFSVVGYSPFTLRLPSTVATAATAALLVVLVRRFASTRTAVVAGIVFMLMPRVTWMATEGRSYALTALLAVLLTLIFTVAMSWSGRDRSQRILIWATYAVVAFVAGGTFIYLALLVVGHGVTAVLTNRRSLLGWLTASLVAGLALLPLALDEAAQTHQIQWIKPLGSSTPHYLLVSQWFTGNNNFSIAGWTLLVLGIVALALQRRSRSLLALVVPWVVLPTVVLLLVTVVLTPVYSARYLTFGAPAVAILIAAALTAPRRRWVAAVGLTLCLALTMESWVLQRSIDGKQNTSWIQVASLVAEERALEPTGQTDAVIYGPLREHPDADMAMLALAYPQQFAGLVDLKQGETAGDRARLWDGRIPLADARSRLGSAPVVWLITSDKRDWRPSVAAQLAVWGYHLDDEWHFDGANVVRYVRN